MAAILIAFYSQSHKLDSQPEDFMRQVKFPKVLAVLSWLLNCLSISGADQITLQFKDSGSQGVVGFRSQMALSVSAMYPEYTILRSTDLMNWSAVAGPINGSVGVSDELLRSTVSLAGDRAFYRVVANVRLAPAESRLGDAVYGYGTEFGRQIQLVGQLPLSDFVALYTPTNQFLLQISFDPTTAKYWDQFNLDPAV